MSGCRHVLTFLAFTGLMNVYTMRMNLGVAIVAMVNATKNQDNTTVEDSCPFENDQNVTDGSNSIEEGEFAWDEYTQGIILGCFFYAYMISNFFGGRIAEVVGVKWTFGVGICSTAVMTMMTPVFAEWSYIALIVLRVLEGLMEGVTFPALHCMMGRWYPKSEWGFVYAVIHTGSSVGSLISLLLSGVLCHSSFLGGWPSAFYVFGAAGLVWVVGWFLLMHEFPEEHPSISKEELQHILDGKEDHTSKKDISLPWFQILTSVPVWMCAIASFGKNWIQNTIQINIPTYLKRILHYDIAQSGILSSLPFIIETILTVLSGYVSKWVLSKKFLGVPATRKLFNTIGLLVGAVGLVCIPSAGCNRQIIIAMLTISAGIGGLCTVGFLVAIVDMSPVFSGTVMGLVNGIGQLSGFLAPLTVGSLTNHNQTSGQWHKIFYISAAISVISAFLFAALGSATLQPWNEGKPKKTSENRESHSSRITLTDVRKYSS